MNLFSTQSNEQVEKGKNESRKKGKGREEKEGGGVQKAVEQ